MCVLTISVKINSSYIPQMEQHGPEGRMLFGPGNVTYLLDVTPSNQLTHPISPPPILLRVIKFKVLVAKQHPTIICTFY